MGRTAEPGGDYGYDLVHQDVPPPSRPETPEGGPPSPGPVDAGGYGGDHGYDEAHDF